MTTLDIGPAADESFFDLAPRGAAPCETRLSARSIRDADGTLSAIYWVMREESATWPSDLL